MSLLEYTPSSQFAAKVYGRSVSGGSVNTLPPKGSFSLSVWLRSKSLRTRDLTSEPKSVRGGSLCLKGRSGMSTQVWMAHAIWSLSLLGVANVVLADATLRKGDMKRVRTNPSLDLQLQPGDLVQVPQSLF